MKDLFADVKAHTLFLIRSATITDLLEEIEDYENSAPEFLEDEEHQHYQACKDAIVVKSLTGS